MYKKFLVLVMFFSLFSFSQNALNRNAFNILGFGARAMGMGGAFIAVADDATAASWNPAGLAQMTSSEFSLVYDAYKGDITWEDYEEVNYSNGWKGTYESVKDEGEMDYSSLAFFSYSMPIDFKGKNFVWQISYANLASPPDFENDYHYRENWYYYGEHVYTADVEGVWKSSGSGAFKTLTLSFSSQIVSNLNLGISLNYLKTNYKEKFEDEANFSNSLGETGYYFDESTKKYDFDDFYFDFGLLYKAEKFSFGAVYHSGFKAKGDIYWSYEDINTPYNEGKDKIELKWPSGYGFGLAFHPLKSLTLALDYSKSNWKDGEIKFSDGESTYFPYLYYDRQFNTTSIRFGLEYVILFGEKAVPIRFGYFQEDRIAAWFVGGDKPKVDGFTIGSGITFKNFQLDFAYVMTKGEESTSGTYSGVTSDNITYQGSYDASIKDEIKRFVLSLIFKF